MNMIYNNIRPEVCFSKVNPIVYKLNDFRYF